MQENCTAAWHRDECSNCGQRRDNKRTLANIPISMIFGRTLAIRHKDEETHGQVHVQVSSIDGSKTSFIKNTSKEMLIIPVSELKDWFVI